MIPFHRTAEGAVAGRFSRDEAALLRELSSELIELLRTRMPLRTSRLPLIHDEQGNPVGSPLVISPEISVPTDRALARLLPDAYRDDPAAAAEHRRLTEAGLLSRKIAGAEQLAETLGTSGAVVLDEAAAITWLQVLGDLRLSLAARLGLHDEDDSERLAEVDPVYDWLSWLQGSLVEVLDT